MRVEEEYQKLTEAIEGAKRSIQQVMELDWAKSQRMRDFYDGMLHQSRYDLVILKIWKDRILGEEEKGRENDEISF